MTDVIGGTQPQTGFSPENYLECRERLVAVVPPEELERSLAKLAIQIALEPAFSVRNHVACAQPEVPGRTWMGAIKKVRHEKFGDTKGFNEADYELEAIMQDLDEQIWGEIEDVPA